MVKRNLTQKSPSQRKQLSQHAETKYVHARWFLPQKNKKRSDFNVHYGIKTCQLWCHLDPGTVLLQIWRVEMSSYVNNRNWTHYICTFNILSERFNLCGWLTFTSGVLIIHTFGSCIIGWIEVDANRCINILVIQDAQNGVEFVIQDHTRRFMFVYHNGLEYMKSFFIS